MISANKMMCVFILTLMLAASSDRLLSKTSSTIVGNLLDPDSAVKMRRTSKEWSHIQIYENVSASKEIAIYRHLSTEKIVWEGTQVTTPIIIKPLGYFESLAVWYNRPPETETIPNKEQLVLLLREQNWLMSFEWLAANSNGLPIALWKQLVSAIGENLGQNWLKTNLEKMMALRLGVMISNPLFKTAMYAIATNIEDLEFANHIDFGSPLMMAARLDDPDSILALIERGVNANQVYRGWTALHVAAELGSYNVCSTSIPSAHPYHQHIHTFSTSIPSAHPYRSTSIPSAHPYPQHIHTLSTSMPSI